VNQWRGCPTLLPFTGRLGLDLADHTRFFRAFGMRVKNLRKAKGWTQEDMISRGFSARHWQQIEAGRPITMTTLLRICQVFSVRPDRLLRGL
jgi:DNA-binding Xre family transcriptional regulator